MTQHLALPLRIADGGRLATRTAGSPAEIGQSVALLLATRVGERRCEPAYGSRDLLFGPAQPPTVDAGAIARWEPRATTAVVDVVLAAS